jgi:hypothetical protein
MRSSSGSQERFRAVISSAQAAGLEDELEDELEGAGRFTLTTMGGGGFVK